MNYLIITVALFSLSSYLHGQVTEHRKSVIEGFVSRCKKHKDAHIIVEQFGRDKGEKIMDSYCKCRVNFVVNNLTFKQVEQIYHGKEKMPEDLFQKMEYECTTQLDSLIK